MSESMPFEEVIFDGTTTGSDQFIRAVRRVALARERHGDDAWCAAYAASCLEGPALAFHERLSEEVQNSWKRLRTALLDRFPSSPSSMSSMPATPAAAGPGSWTPATDIQDWKRETRESVTLESSPEIMTVSQTEGRIRIVDMDKFTIGYLSTAVHPDGPGYTLSRDISEALLLRLSKTPDRHGCYELEIINPGLQGRLLFAKFKAASPYIGTGSVNYCCFASSARDYKKHVGPGQSSVWYPCQDGTLDAFWMQDDQTRYLLESAWDPSDMEPGLVPDFAGYDKKRPGIWKRVRFIFERCL